jgi:hypothetical protein
MIRSRVPRSPFRANFRLATIRQRTGVSLIESRIAILHRGSDEIDEFCNNIVGKFIVCQAFA